MKRLRPVDVVVIGAGWTGLLVAKEVASRTGLTIQVLERGPSRSSTDYQTDMDEVDYLIHHRLTRAPSLETVTLRHAVSDRAVPMRYQGSFFPGSGIGGSGEHWGALSYRYPPDSFQVYTRTVEKYGVKRLPVDHSMRDWPFTYDELEPFYTRAERMMGISGKAGNIKGQRQDGGNIFEGHRSEEFPNPPLKLPYFGSMFREAAQSLGYHPYPTPTATLSRTYTNPDGVTRGPCAFCGFCAGFGCMIGSKAQPSNTLLPLLRRMHNATIKTSSWVRRIQTENGRAVGVQYVNDAGEEYFQPAELVVLAGFTLNNSRLLLLSKIGEPYNPKTGKGALGANLTHRVNPSTTLFFDKPLNRFMGGGGPGLTFSDFDGDNLDHTNLSFIRGGIMRVNCQGSHPIENFGSLPERIEARWGSEWKKQSIYLFDRVGVIQFDGEHLPYKGNYLDLDPVYKDKNGDPLLRVTFDWQDNDRQMAAFITNKAMEIGHAMGAKDMRALRPLQRYDISKYQSPHVQGGTAMGASPVDSVVNMYGQHWEVPNLFIVGASVYPQDAAPNPTLTLIALASRTADALVDRYLKTPRKLLV